MLTVSLQAVLPLSSNRFPSHNFFQVEHFSWFFEAQGHCIMFHCLLYLMIYIGSYFMDVRLYHKAKSVTEPFAYSDYRKKRIQEKIEEARKNRVQVRHTHKLSQPDVRISVAL